MKSISELTDYYYRDLNPVLRELEQKRTMIVSRLKWYGGMGAVAVAIALAWISKNYGLDHPFAFILGALSLSGSIVVYRLLTKNYDSEFKNRIIAPLIHMIGPNLHYNPDFVISRHLFERSTLFPHSIDRYSGNDYVKGTIEEINIEFSDIHAEYQTKDSKGRTQWHTLFRGLFLVAEFNKTFQSKTLVLPDQAQKTFGSLIGGWLQSNNFGRGNLIRLDDPEFEKKFVVYGDDPIEARYILTHSMMKRILEFQKKFSHPLSLAFVHNHLHVAINSGKDLFEPSVFTSLLDYTRALEYITLLRSTIGIVEELKLNEKLWSKA